MFAAAQGGKHENGRETFGHSLVVDPWGRILAEGGTEPGVILADIDPAQIAAARARIPSLQSRPALRARRADGRADPSARGAGTAMIRYALNCEKGHAFESWFQNSAAYDKQVEARAGDLPDLRLRQGREGDHGAAAWRAPKWRRAA